MNRRVHDAAGATVGTVRAIAKSEGQTAYDRVLEAIGGGLGGAAASRVHDALEPPSSPNHRSLFHSVAWNILVAYHVPDKLDTAAAWCRMKAAEQRALAARPDIPLLMQILHEIVASVLHMVAGALHGTLPGYLSHVALDFTTPASLPLLV